MACPVLSCAHHRTRGFSRLSQLAEHLREQHRVGYAGLEHWKVTQLGLVMCPECDNPYVRLGSTHRCRGRRDPLGGDVLVDAAWDSQQAPWAFVDSIPLERVFGRRFHTPIRTSYSDKVWAGLADIINKIGRLTADDARDPEARRRAWVIFFLIPGWILRAEENDLEGGNENVCAGETFEKVRSGTVGRTRTRSPGGKR